MQGLQLVVLSLQEVAAARTIAQRGVVLIGTAHGTSMKDLLCNPVLKPLVGGVTPVTLGDVSANQSNRGQKVGGACLGQLSAYR